MLSSADVPLAPAVDSADVPPAHIAPCAYELWNDSRGKEMLRHTDELAPFRWSSRLCTAHLQNRPWQAVHAFYASLAAGHVALSDLSKTMLDHYEEIADDKQSAAEKQSVPNEITAASSETAATETTVAAATGAGGGKKSSQGGRDGAWEGRSTVRLVVAYDGGAFHGYQSQQGAVTVQSWCGGKVRVGGAQHGAVGGGIRWGGVSWIPEPAGSSHGAEKAAGESRGDGWEWEGRSTVQVVVAYDGGAFHGYQSQQGEVTVQRCVVGYCAVGCSAEGAGGEGGTGRVAATFFENSQPVVLCGGWVMVWLWAAGSGQLGVAGWEGGSGRATARNQEDAGWVGLGGLQQRSAAGVRWVMIWLWDEGSLGEQGRRVESALAPFCEHHPKKQKGRARGQGGSKAWKERREKKGGVQRREEGQEKQREEGQEKQREERQEKQREERQEKQREEGQEKQREERQEKQREERQEKKREEGQEKQREEGQEKQREEGQEKQREEGQENGDLESMREECDKEGGLKVTTRAVLRRLKNTLSTNGDSGSMREECDKEGGLNVTRAAVVVAGRTDKGVHAAGQVCAFHTWKDPLDLTAVAAAVDAATEGSLRVIRISKVPRSFHPQFSARWRRYLYLLPLLPWEGCAVEQEARHSPTEAAGAALGTLPWEGCAVEQRRGMGTLPWEECAAHFSHTAGAAMGTLPWEECAAHFSHTAGAAMGTLPWEGCAESRQHCLCAVEQEARHSPTQRCACVQRPNGTGRSEFETGTVEESGDGEGRDVARWEENGQAEERQGIIAGGVCDSCARVETALKRPATIQSRILLHTLETHARAHGPACFWAFARDTAAGRGSGSATVCNILRARAFEARLPVAAEKAGLAGATLAGGAGAAGAVRTAFAEDRSEGVSTGAAGAAGAARAGGAAENTGQSSAAGCSRVLCVELVGDRFLRRMVRVLVATAVREAAAGGGDDCLLRLAATGERRSTAPPAPAAGLCLVDVGYSDALPPPL
ncbi:unnamed protein product [Closterium sp. Naga37s-1]|nr:unnamed protein product [Closterium sp. Naga37s-1]